MSMARELVDNLILTPTATVNYVQERGQEWKEWVKWLLKYSEYLRGHKSILEGFKIWSTQPSVCHYPWYIDFFPL